MLLKNWIRQAGVELTRITPWAHLDEESAPDDIKEAAQRQSRWSWDRDEYIRDEWLKPLQRRHIDEIETKGIPFYQAFRDVVLRVGFDPCCVEIPSTKLDNWSKLDRFFHAVDNFGDDNNLLRFSELICGTGGHIHVSVRDIAEACHIKRIALNHPELLWAFAHPDDTQHYTDHQTADNAKKQPYENDWGDMVNESLYNGDTIEDDKSFAISWREDYKTVEFRMFDVAQTWEMQEEHMAFAQAFMKYALSMPRPKKLMTIEDVQALTVEQHMKAFERTIRRVGLPWKRYMDYVDNIKLRHEWDNAPSFMYEHS